MGGDSFSDFQEGDFSAIILRPYREVQPASFFKFSERETFEMKEISRSNRAGDSSFNNV